MQKHSDVIANINISLSYTFLLPRADNRTTITWAGVVSGLQPRHYSSLTAPNLQPTANQERNDQCGNQHHSRELLVMGIVVPETC